ncbi:MAG: DUF1573 domain-containing protein [Flavobacteriaceae bacterium]
MRTIFTLIISLVMTTAFQAQNSGDADTGDKPVISAESFTIEYGQILKDSDGLRTFEFTNTGKSPLVIKKVSSSCGCTVPQKPEQPIMPGEKGEIKIKYDTRRLGRISKSVYILSNASEPRTVVKIKGEVLKEFPVEEEEPTEGN